MGKEVVYCSKCGTRIREEDFKAGRAFVILGRYACAECKDPILASLSPAEREQYEKSAALQQGLTPIPGLKDRPGSSSTKLKPVPGETSGVPAMATPATQSESQMIKKGAVPTPGAPLRSPTEPIPKQPPASPPPMSRKTPMPRPTRRPGQTSRPYAVTSKKKGAPAGLIIGIGILLVIGLIVVILVLSQKH